MVAFVAGATGYTGRSVVSILRERGFEVVAHIRPGSSRLAVDGPAFEALGASISTCAWEDHALAAALSELAPSMVFGLIGTTRARAGKDGVQGDIYETVDYGLSAMLLRAAAACGSSPKFIYLSSMGVGTTEPRNAYLRARFKLERDLRQSGLAWVSARPSFITGDRDESRPMESIGAVVGNGALSLVSALGGRRWAAKYRSQTGHELASALVALALDPAVRGDVVESDRLRQLGTARAT